MLWSHIWHFNCLLSNFSFQFPLLNLHVPDAFVFSFDFFHHLLLGHSRVDFSVPTTTIGGLGIYSICAFFVVDGIYLAVFDIEEYFQFVIHHIFSTAALMPAVFVFALFWLLIALFNIICIVVMSHSDKRRKSKKNMGIDRTFETWLFFLCLQFDVYQHGDETKKK